MKQKVLNTHKTHHCKESYNDLKTFGPQNLPQYFSASMKSIFVLLLLLGTHAWKENNLCIHKEKSHKFSSFLINESALAKFKLNYSHFSQKIFIVVPSRTATMTPIKHTLAALLGIVSPDNMTQFQMDMQKMTTTNIIRMSRQKVTSTRKTMR